ncbi:hypothetical protein NE237_009865 [Protea cynaroides]|uniref:Uncharacterized protein n=1 Tax=Protea cynaroides TaxID=273540 RepID=A0A9Q0KYN9_9MAGN|nr:hypothetical protein NE237_009865 [Protea cynaroides]
MALDIEKPSSKGQACMSYCSMNVFFTCMFCTTGLPSNVVIEVENMTFHLHKVGQTLGVGRRILLAGVVGVSNAGLLECKIRGGECGFLYKGLGGLNGSFHHFLFLEG